MGGVGNGEKEFGENGMSVYVGGKHWEAWQRILSSPN